MPNIHRLELVARADHVLTDGEIVLSRDQEEGRAPLQRSEPGLGKDTDSFPQIQDRRSMLSPCARERFQLLPSESLSGLQNHSSEPEHTISSFCSTKRDAADLSFQCVIKKCPRKHLIQDDTWLLIRQTQKKRGLMLKSRRAIRARSMHCAFFVWCLASTGGSLHSSNRQKFSECALDVSALCKLEVVALRILESLQYTERCAPRRHRRVQWNGVAGTAQRAADQNDLMVSTNWCPSWCIQNQGAHSSS